MRLSEKIKEKNKIPGNSLCPFLRMVKRDLFGKVNRDLQEKNNWLNIGFPPHVPPPRNKAL